MVSNLHKNSSKKTKKEMTKKVMRQVTQDLQDLQLLWELECLQELSYLTKQHCAISRKYPDDTLAYLAISPKPFKQSSPPSVIFVHYIRVKQLWKKKVILSIITRVLCHT